MPELRVVTVPEAARILGRTPDAVRGLIRRGTLISTRGNDGRPRVHLSQELATVATGDRDGREAGAGPDPTSRDGRDRLLVEELRERLGKIEVEAGELRKRVACLQDEREAARIAAASAEGEARVLRDALADLSCRLDRAEAELRQPWWRRLLR